MFAKLEELVTEMRTITDAIAHDIRTPLMRMRMHAESALASKSIRDARPMLEKAVNESETAIRITSLALEISRAEVGIDKSGFASVNLVALVREIVAAYEPVAESLDIKLSFEHSTARDVFGHPQLLGQAITNLIDNVFRHAAQGRVCEIRVEQVGGYMRLQVGDRGAGISSEDRQLAVRRFVKLTASRASEGAGLGLALVDAVARLHGGDLNLEDNVPGLRVIMLLPFS